MNLHLAPEKEIGLTMIFALHWQEVSQAVRHCPLRVRIFFYGRNAEGNSWRSGGWGPLLADEGSGYWFGIEAMKAATRASDGHSQPTALLPSVLKFLEISNIDSIMHRVYVQKMSRSEIASLSPLVISAAKDGDTVSLEIVNNGIQCMAECVSIVAQKLDLMEHCELSLTGGVFKRAISSSSGCALLFKNEFRLQSDDGRTATCDRVVPFGSSIPENSIIRCENSRSPKTAAVLFADV